MATTTRGELLWEPPPDVLTASELGGYLEWLREHHDLSFATYEQLWRWSVDDLDAFWSSIAAWSATIWHTPPTATLVSREMPGTRWFVDGTLNYAEHALRAAQLRPEATAVVAHSQSRPPVALSWAELVDAVGRCRRGLERLGVHAGDRVVAYLPNIAETLVAFLATAALGATWSSCAPEFGVRSVVDRFAQIEPTVLLAVDGYRYGTRAIDRTDDVAAVRGALPTLRH